MWASKFEILSKAKNTINSKKWKIGTNSSIAQISVIYKDFNYLFYLVHVLFVIFISYINLNIY